ncbi:protective antigen-related [Plasmodium yoelii yoelii]|uniref:Protective antigen-related n=1 Tax=Plasmodium yoelii yoelii TaxID=73239 RepID=Q7R947_PLAYO|nr:protective antigen-related [Plasmodium yoelii yoelii]
MFGTKFIFNIIKNKFNSLSTKCVKYLLCITSAVYIIIEAFIYISTNKKNRIHIDQRADIKIRQCDETLKIDLFTKKLTKKIHIGEVKIDINSSIVEKSFPKNEWLK